MPVTVGNVVDGTIVVGDGVEVVAVVGGGVRVVVGTVVDVDEETVVGGGAGAVAVVDAVRCRRVAACVGMDGGDECEPATRIAATIPAAATSSIPAAA